MTKNHLNNNIQISLFMTWIKWIIKQGYRGDYTVEIVATYVFKNLLSFYTKIRINQVSSIIWLVWPSRTDIGFGYSKVVNITSVEHGFPIKKNNNLKCYSCYSQCIGKMKWRLDLFYIHASFGHSVSLSLNDFV